MKIHRFFFEQKIQDTKTLHITQTEFIHQVKNVFRFDSGDQLVLFDNTGYDFYFSIEKYEKDYVSLSFIKKEKNNVSLDKEFYLFASIVKKDNFEWIVQKATELGVAHIVPIISDRSEKKDLNMDRIRKISIEASEQSGRATVPIIHEIKNLELCLSEYSNIKSIAWHTIADKFVSQDLSDIKGLYIGPEGGWTEKEINMFHEKGISVKSLGPQVLRAETAVIAALSQIVF